ncbi:diguanylate cyclase [Pseudogemmobacter sonorensis]|uniref:diguanylate cyclase n=1 Tax=Pseudogemmobacter sonorensis TaxID=2989681 RepID=UPI003681726C
MNRRILIIDGTAANRIVYKVKLSDACYLPVLAPDGQSGLRAVRAERPDMVLLNLSLPDIPGEEVIAALRADPLSRGVPVIALCPPGADGPEGGARRIAALRAGADDALPRDVSDALLLARIRNLSRGHETERVVRTAWGREAPALLGLAEPAATFVAPGGGTEPDGTGESGAGQIGLLAFRVETAMTWKHRLKGRLRDRLTVLTRAQALTLAPGRGIIPEVMMIEVGARGSGVEASPGGAAGRGAGGGSGLQLLSQLASNPGTRHTAFCIVMPDEDDALAAMAFDLDAGEVVTAATPPAELELRLRALLRRKRHEDRLRTTVEDGLRAAMVDPLTGLYNRRYAMPRLAGIAEQALDEGSDFAVMVVDLDRFKTVNDLHGHSAGDAVLAEVARRLSDSLRGSDLLARLGGEEFLVALPQTGPDEARQVAERLRGAVGDRPIDLPSGAQLRVTISIGVKLCRWSSPGGAPPVAQGGCNISHVIEEADMALLSSKSSGRNLVTFSLTAA